MHLNNEQIEIILDGCRLNNRAAQKELYSHYYGYAMSIAQMYANGYDNAVEMVNDGFLRIFTSLKSFEPRFENVGASFTVWIRRIIVNACIDHIRKYQKKEMAASVEITSLIISTKDQGADQKLEQKDIINCVQQLSPAYKGVFSLFVIEGYSHEEIARELNISVGASKSNLFKARQQLQELLKKSNVIEQ